MIKVFVLRLSLRQRVLRPYDLQRRNVRSLELLSLSLPPLVVYKKQGGVSTGKGTRTWSTAGSIRSVSMFFKVDDGEGGKLSRWWW